ncbi:TAR DNA-binding protein 43-like [Sipha flava]|jgi:RNA recognition motif-containing protein|uniref:TAR DNA-binding protein 43 n=1 Tax=Sipha flava TaxID=143950 RepID=A0A2S2QEV7_9HEMI|nr:TAR DNA-binding protein 43-like [Sipha flava]
MYVQVSESENSDPIDMPTEEDNSLLLSTLEAQYPGIIGLKYRVNNRLRIVRLNEGKLYPPEDGWLDRIYMCNFRNTPSAKRKHNEIENSTKTEDDDDDDSVSDMDLVVLGLPWKVTEEDLKKYFAKFGQVEYTQIKTDANGKSKGYGFVRFKHKKSQVRVMLERHNIEGRWCDVRIPNSKDKQVNKVPRKVFIGQVSEDVDEDALRNYFIKFGEISDLFLPRPHRGFAFVTFTDPLSAQKVIGKDHKVGDCSVVCTEAIPKKEMAPKWNEYDNRDRYKDKRRDRSPKHQQSWSQNDNWDYDREIYERLYTRGNGQQLVNSNFASDKNINPDMVAAAVNKAVMGVFGNLKGGQGNQSDKTQGIDDWWMRR